MVRAAVAGNHRTPEVVVGDLIRDDSAAVRAGVAGRIGLHDHLVPRSVCDIDPAVRWTIAGNMSDGKLDVVFLLLDKEIEVRSRAAVHPRMPWNFVEEGGHLSVAPVRRAFARNLCAPTEMLQELAQDDDPAVRAAVMRNPATPQKLMLELLHDPDSWVSQESGPPP